MSNTHAPRAYIRVGAFSPIVHIGNPLKNAQEIIATINESKELLSCRVIVTPELSLTGYTCQDMFFNNQMINNLQEAINYIQTNMNDNQIIIVGLPYKGHNCSVALTASKSGKYTTLTAILLAEKRNIPNYSEFYERRWFTPGNKFNLLKIESNFGYNTKEQEHETEEVILGAEICEDLWSPNPPSTERALFGANIIVNNSASNETIGKAEYRRQLVSQQSARTISAYVYCSAGMTESTQDIVFGGHNIIAENGKILAESDLFDLDSKGIVVADIDIQALNHDRNQNRTFAESRLELNSNNIRNTYIFDTNAEEKTKPKYRKVSLTPFVPSTNINTRCNDIFNIQVAGLAARWKRMSNSKLVIGVSGGLDSTLALLVAVGAADKIGYSRDKIIGITMPCFGTTSRTKDNAIKLMNELGITYKEINIGDSVKQHLKDIGLSEDDRSIAYENAQARERTQVLMDYANMVGGFVIGTGDLSELALGWCTYNGDHMSMYSVNSSIPKTLVRSLVEVIGCKLCSTNKKVIFDILDTPVSPELLPPSKDGTIAQLTEDSVGPYILNDFFLYYHLRYGKSIEEIKNLALVAISQQSNSSKYNFSEEDIDKWLNKFMQRFYRAQFKRNCCPDGVKVGSVSLNPRGDFRCPTEYEYF